MHRRSTLPIALVLVAATAPAAAAGASTTSHGPLTQACHVLGGTAPQIDAVCETEATVGANVSLGGYGSPCLPGETGAELCDGPAIGLEVTVRGDGSSSGCVAAKGVVDVCYPIYVLEGDTGLP